MPRWTVVLADASDAYVHRVESVLAKSIDFEVVARVSNGPAAVELTEALRPHVIVVASDLPTPDGLLTVSALVEASPTSKIIVCTTRSDTGEEAIRAHAHGAVATVSKAEAVQVLREILVRVVE